jgi:hypothetical protein
VGSGVEVGRRSVSPLKGAWIDRYLAENEWIRDILGHPREFGSPGSCHPYNPPRPALPQAPLSDQCVRRGGSSA